MGRMAELDYLFSEADLDIIGVQESRLPRTLILQTTDYTVFNSGASRCKHHYGVQLWIKKRHAEAVKSTEAVNPRLLVAKIAMRASPHDRVARILHVFVLHSPCEVAAPHDSDAFYMQVHERMNAVPRGQLCLLLGDSNARVGVPLLIVLENMRPSLRTRMVNGCVNCSLRITWSHSTLFSQETPAPGRKYLEDMPS